MTHKTKDCVERPRKVGAKWNNKEIKGDEYVQASAKLTFDAKRDRYAGYDPRMHQATINKFKMKEEERRRKRIAEMDKLAAENAAKRALKEAQKKERRERRRKAREAKMKAKQEGKAGGSGALSGEDSDSDADSDGESDDEDDEDDDQGDVKRDEASDTLFGKEFRVGQGTKVGRRRRILRFVSSLFFLFSFFFLSLSPKLTFPFLSTPRSTPPLLPTTNPPTQDDRA